MEDEQSSLWIATDDVYRCNRRTGEVYSIFNDQDFLTNYSDKGYYEHKIIKAQNGQIWIGRGTGLFRLNRDGRKFKQINLGKRVANVTAVYEDDDQNLWAGAMQMTENKYHTCLFKLNTATNQISKYSLATWPYNAPQKEDQFIYHILQSDSNYLWLATGFGLLRFGKQNGTTKKYSHVKNDSTSLSNDQVKTICVDPRFPNRYLWLGTADGGLNRFDITNESFACYTISDGLSSNHISAILSHNQDYLWLATNNGITKDTLNRQSGDFISLHNFDVSDGLPGSDFTYYYGHNAFKTQKGELIFTGPNDFIIFNPDDIKKDFHSPKKNLYAFKMEGYNDSWILNGTDRFAHFTKLPFGTYTFRARAANSDGVWNEQGTSIKIIITPPLWRSWWAYLLNIVIFMGILFGSVQFQLNRQKLKQALVLKDIETEKLQELDRMKSNFFANISHEFRTPLTLILGPLQSMLHKEVDPKRRNDLRMIRRNASRLLRLINQLLDLSKVEFKHMQLKAHEENIVPYLKQLTMAFESAAKRKKVHLRFFSKQNQILCYFDPDKIQKIIFNLLTNALKVTPMGGRVLVSLSVCNGEDQSLCLRNDGCVKIIVKDTGIRIPKVDLHYIFDRFYQVGGSSARTREGTGIGLALVKELVELHHGDIQLKSAAEMGTTFVISLPLG